MAVNVRFLKSCAYGKANKTGVVDDDIADMLKRTGYATALTHVEYAVEEKREKRKRGRPSGRSV